MRSPRAALFGLPIGTDQNPTLRGCVGEWHQLLEMPVHQAEAYPCQEQPNEDDYHSSCPGDRLASVHYFLRSASAVFHYRSGDHPADQHAERGGQQVVQVSQHGDEVGDQVDGGKVSHDDSRSQLGVPGSAPVPAGKVEGVRFPFQFPGNTFPPLEQSQRSRKVQLRSRRGRERSIHRHYAYAYPCPSLASQLPPYRPMLPCHASHRTPRAVNQSGGLLPPTCASLFIPSLTLRHATAFHNTGPRVADRLRSFEIYEGP